MSSSQFAGAKLRKKIQINTDVSETNTAEKSGSGIRPLRRRPLLPFVGRTLRGEKERIDFIRK